MAMPVGVRIVFPRQMDLFESKYMQRSPAIMARASMSIPVFFEPKELELRRATWQRHVRGVLAGAYPNEFVDRATKLSTLEFIDGGMLSNFPIDAFQPLTPSSSQAVPTIGVALTSTPAEPRKQARPGSLRAFVHHAITALNSMRHMRDTDALLRARHVAATGGKTHVAFVDTGDHNWLNFNMSAEQVEDLYVKGLCTCAEFLS
jgi:NTE family protein